MNIKQELVLKAALLDCENSLQAAYNFIDNNAYNNSGDLLETINVSLTILALMKGYSKP